ncbi:60S ribosome biogenesis protein Sqt1 [Ophiocordyceps sinensis CO18]|uniref:60S ribosome biogenesis protein Sqt1 n=1 Tax=Ophiocordyceps sinensis (strain Co18 / CGMCC 3.14243) TaxID=911162 RepID=T5AF09_OPHSC|nr:60S ribosome biogenesis protein Sqt1 [Ophiocordyceps sinensis CO18]
MSSAEDKVRRPGEHDDEDMDEMLAAEDAAEEIAEVHDVAMDSDNEDDVVDDVVDEVVLHNDSIAYFDLPSDSLFAIAQHPTHPSLVALGGSAGPQDDAPGAGWIFVPQSWLLTSCGMDGVVRRWDLRAGGATGSSAAADAGLLKEWRGHRGDGEGGGVLCFVQGQTGERVVTAGDDGLALVFEA